MQITYNKKAYPEMSTHDMWAAGGYIPLWVVEWNLRHSLA